MSRSTRYIAAILALVTFAGACSAKNTGDSANNDDNVETPSGTETSTDADFGTLTAPCGDGDTKVDPSEAGKGTDKLYLGIANDRSSSIRPGLNKELYDSAVAFTEWCNDKGGIGGLEIGLVDLDGSLLEVGSAMATACQDVFMMVGGFYVQDNLQFTGKPESDFHQCGMAAIPASVVSPEMAGANGQIQAVPHPSEVIGSAQIRTLAETNPEAASKMAEVWGDLPAMETIKNQSVAIMDAEDGVENVGVFSYPVTGLEDWTPLATQIINSGATSFHFVGEPTNLGALVAKLREQGWDGVAVLETNSYDPVYKGTAGDAADGSFIRTVFHPFEEADQWPAVQQYLDILAKYVPDHKEQASLGLQGFSTWLLFAEAANACAADNDNVLTRECVLTEAEAIEEWVGGGLQAVTNPGGIDGIPPACEVYLDVVDGEFVRSYPELGGEGDDGEGFYCPEDTIVPVPANEGLGIVDPDRAI